MRELNLLRNIKMSHLILILTFSLLAHITTSDQSASFYGESYISVPIKDASSSTHLSLLFKTHRPHGLLLLAAGTTDNLVLEVKSGMVEVRVNLGSGEAVVFSSPSIRLDDQQWHEVKVNRTSGLLELTVDGVLQGSVSTPGSFHELNVEDGIFLGGLGTYSSPQHLHLHSFRGCMKKVLYNENGILEVARSMKSAMNSMEITWDCDSEFSAGSGDPVSFLSETSFVAFPRFHVKEKGAFACDFKTRSDSAVLLFNSGQGNFKDDFLSLEILDGQLKLSVNSGSGLVEAVLIDKINDGRWHQLDLTVTQDTVELHIDNATNTTRFGGEQSHLNLAGHLFVGGLGLKARSHALRLGLAALQGERAMKGSLVGCVHNIVINSRPFSFREVQVSRHVDNTCSWTFPCASEPCVEDSECVENGQQFRCICDQPVCEKGISNKDSVPGEEGIHQLIVVQALEVQEGGHAIINTNTIDVIFDYRSYKIREMAVRFRVLIPPRFGRLEIDRGHRQAESFTLLDLLASKVNYVHDGTDSETDDITLELSVNGGSEVPTKFRGNFEFVLPIKVVSHHDPPVLILPNGNQISILNNSKLQITTAVVDVRDSDTPDAALNYHVHFVRAAQSFFENYTSSGEAIASFTHKDILDGRVWFVHKEDSVIDVYLNISDDTLQQDSIIVRFVRVPLKIETNANTGLTIPYTTSMLLLASNLSAVTNVPLLNLELRYRLTKLPQFGQIQRLQHGVEEWTDIDTFTQRHLNTSRIRYRHTAFSDLTTASDEFSFVVSARDVETPEQSFKVMFVPVLLTVSANNRFVIQQVPFGRLQNTSLLIGAKDAQINATKLIFVIYRAPKLGSVYVVKENQSLSILDFDLLQPLQVSSNFSQDDINRGRVYFKFYNAGFERQEDYIDVTGKYPSSSGRMLRVWVEYAPAKSATHFTNNGLHNVAEGGMKVISKKELYLERDGYKDFQFSLIRPPSHGSISLIYPRFSNITVLSVEAFTSADIREGRVVYRHDDSENDRDSLMLNAVPLFTSEENMPEEIEGFTGTFHIFMTMRNDNPPERLVDKVFHIVRNGRKTLTIEDLEFTDRDIHFNSSELQYRCQTLANGEILLTDSGSPVYQFKQLDLEMGHLIFQHRGADVGHSALFVTDGQYIWTGQFEVQASSPYINVTTSTSITVMRGGRAVIASSNLSCETNLETPPSLLSFVVTDEPLHGSIQVDAKESTEFTFADVLAGRVEYVHDGGDAEEDLFRFTVVSSDVQARGSLPVLIDDERLHQPPDVVHNQILKIKEGETAHITKTHLLLHHPSLGAEELVFIVTKPPRHGFLQLRGSELKEEETIQFSQGDINQGEVAYVHTGSSVTDDQFTFDVDSDTSALRNLVFFVEVSPSSLPIEAGRLSVPEGGAIALSSVTLKPLGLQFERDSLIFEVMKIPAHGYIHNKAKTDPHNMAFTSSDLVQGNILYQHDDSESITDSFAVVASLPNGSLKSQMVTVPISIIPKNDQPPHVVINKGLNVWADSVTLITGEHLLADDPDTASGDIIFTASSPTNGHLAFLNNTFVRIFKFSQSDIYAGRVAFVHQGNSIGHFNFQANDGTSLDIQRVFRVHASPVVLEVSRRGPLAVFPATMHPLTNNSLLTITNLPNFTKPIVYTIINPKPSRGKLVTKLSGKPLEIKSFTQDEISSGKIFYQHVEDMQQWRQKDSIFLEISTAYATTLSGQIVDVDISFENINSENQAMLLGLYKASVVEGKSVVITKTHLDSSTLLQRLQAFHADITMTFRVAALPGHGDLYLGDRKLTLAFAFTQEDIDAGRLRYEHDDSDSLEDVFSLSVLLGTGGGDVRGVVSPKYKVNFSIEVRPVNDQEFTLITQHPELRVLQGAEVPLSQDTLLTTDLDTPADGIVYYVLSNPGNGRLVRRSDMSSKVDNFTQHDINSGALAFVQNGSCQNGSMYFKVTDGQFPALYRNLFISVIPVFLDVSGVKPLLLTQSESSVNLSSQFLEVLTNGAKEALRYTLVTMPQHGHIVKNGQQVKQFSHDDVENNTIVYAMHDYSSSEDVLHYEIHVEGLDVSLKDLTLRIIVKPLVKQTPLIVPAGASVAITKINLDATELAQRTRDNPTFQIISPPRYGMLLRKLRKRRDMIAQPVLKPVESFTFEDVVYGKIFYVSNASDIEGPPVQDSFSFMLKAQNAQPAVGKFLINVDESDVFDVDGTLDSSGKDHDVSKSQSDEMNQTNDIVIVGVVLGVLLALAITAVIVFVLWRRHRWEEEQYKEVLRQRNKPRPYISGPLQLEQPHVTIEPHGLGSPGEETEAEEERCLMRHSTHQAAGPAINLTHDADSPLHPLRTPDLAHTERSSAVPDCRVTPLVEGKMGVCDQPLVLSRERRQSERSNNSADLCDWTLLDSELLQQCHLETPVLRANQYWV